MVSIGAGEPPSFLPAFCGGIRYFGEKGPDFGRLASAPVIGEADSAVGDAGDERAAFQTLLAADALRYLTLQITAAKSSGHPGGFASSAEAHAALVMLGHTNILTEVGHHAPGFYAALFLDSSLEAMGIHTVDDLMMRFREQHGLLGHLSGAVPGVLAPAGPLGQGQHFAMAAAYLYPGTLFPVTIGDGGMGEPYVLNAMMHFHAAFPSVTNFLPVLVWNGHSQEHHSMVSHLTNEQMLGLWRAHGFEEVVLVDAASFGDGARNEAFVDGTCLSPERRLAFAGAVLQGVDRAARAARAGRPSAFIIKQMKGAGLHVTGARSHNLLPRDTLDRPEIEAALRRLALPPEGWQIVRANFRRAGGGPAARTAVTEQRVEPGLPPRLELQEFPRGVAAVPATALGALAAQVGRAEERFLVGSSDGTEASAMRNVIEALGIRHPTADPEYGQGPEGRVYEPVNEDACAGLTAGLALFGTRSLWTCYESFAANGWPIVQTVTQAMAELRRRVPSVVCVFTAGALEQGRNGWTHQRPEIEGHIAAMMRNGNVYLLYPCDANVAQAAYEFATGTWNKGVVIIASKSSLPVYLGTDEARRAVAEGAVVLHDSGDGRRGRVVLAVTGDMVLLSVFAAREMLERLGYQVAIVSVINPRRLCRPDDVSWAIAAEPDGEFISDARFEELFAGDLLLGISGGSSAALEPVLLRSRAPRRDLLAWQRGETTSGPAELLAVNRLSAEAIVQRVAVAFCRPSDALSG